MRILTRFVPWSSARLPRRANAPPTSVAAPDPTLRAATPGVLTPVAPAEAAAVTERRAATLRAMFPLLFSRHARRADLWQAIVIERYLAQAANLADLERRINEVQRRRQFSWSE